MTHNPTKLPVLPFIRLALSSCIHALCLAGVLAVFQSAGASTTINSGATFTIDNSNTTIAGYVTTWNDTGTLTINGGGTLQTWPPQNRTVFNNNNIVFAGSGGTITMRFNDNDTDFQLNGASITSTATGAQTLAVFTGNNSNGDRESVTFNAGIPNVSDGSAMSFNVTYNTQGSPNWVNLKGANTFTGPITLAHSDAGTASGILTIGGTLTQYNGNTSGSGTLNSGNYAGAIALGARTIFNYASSATQTLSGAISGAGALQVTGGTLTLSGASTFSGSTTVNSGKSLILGSAGKLKFFITDAATNNKVTGAGTATLNGIFTIDHSAVTATSGSWTLVNTTAKTFGGTFRLDGFTGPLSNIYTKSAAGQNWTFNTTTGVLSLSSQAIITAFGIPGSAGVINQTAKTIALTVPYGTSLATLAPTYTLTSGSCTASSSSPPSPTFAAANPAHYIVTDGAISNDYTVTVSVTPASSAKDVLTCEFGALGSGTISGTDILFTVPPGQSLSMAPTFTLSPFATLSPLSGSTQNFSSPVIYTVTAQNGTTKAYTLIVQAYDTWAHSGSFFISTTPHGANITAGPAETDFPLLVRFNSSNFNFAEAESDGRDLRFTTAAGANLKYQIEQWDAVNGVAAVWVKIPSIAANARQELIMYWGKSGVVSQSSGASVFNTANGYVSVMHLNETVADSVGTLTPTNVGTTVTHSLIGKGRTFVAGNGVNCGDGLTTLPSGNTAHSTQAWFRSDTSGFDIFDWAREDAGKKVQIRLVSPPQIVIDGNFAGVTGVAILSTSQWHHVVNTYTPGNPGVSRIYIDGQLDASGSATVDITPPSIMRLGGWYNNYSFVGEMDEARLSKFTRSANWIKMEYESQKPLQTMVGTLVQAGSTFSASPESVTMGEGTSTDLTGEAGGAQKVFWIRKENGVETILAVDQFTLNVPAGRVTGNRSFVIQFKGIYPNEIRTVDIPVTVTDDIADPEFTLTGPSSWDGRETIMVTPEISNLDTLQAQGLDNFTYKWTVNGVAVVKQITPGVLTLTRAQGDGPLTLTLVMDNGGGLVSRSKIITVQQPASDDWVQRTPDANEKPVTNQFFARDPSGFGTIHYRGTQAGSPATVFLKVYTTDGGDVLYATHRQALVGGAYTFAAPIAAGKVTYKVQYGTTTGGVDTPVGAAVTNLVCGDAYIIEGQSNALATDNAAPNSSVTDPWIRTYGLTSGWGGAVSKGGELQLGLWGWILANRLSTNHSMPICIITAAVGGTRIDQHRPNPAGHGGAGTLYSIYANLYNRVVGARLTHGIRAVLWHQGEQDQGSGGPDGDYDYKFYQQYFVDISAAWKQDFPNILNYYVFQIWPGACGDTSRNDQLREVQRTLSRLYSNLEVMSTHGIVPGSSCHYELAGYQKFSDLLGPLIAQDHYGVDPAGAITAADLRKAYFTTATQNEIALEFGQNVAWNPGAPGLLFLDGVAGKVASGSATGNVIKLQLTAASTAATITYLKGTVAWNQANILYGSNGIAALTFADVPIEPTPTGYESWASDPAQGLTAGQNDDPLDDPDFEGITNLLEFTLGGAPTVSSQAILPTLENSGGAWSFEYDRSDLSLSPATTQVVEYGSDLTGWTPVTIPTTSAGIVTITPGSPSDHVKVTIPAPGTEMFVRLKVTQ